jgi:hypothetical protein
MTRRRLLVPTIVIFLVAVLVRLFAAALVPIVQDEAYYLEWSKALDWGYFDHPPLVAWIGITSWLAPASAFAGRLGAMVVAALSFPFMVGLLRQAGLKQRAAYLAGLLMVNFNFCGIFFGALTTPDAVFVTAWCAALYEAAAALNGDRPRWLSAGLAVGLGMLSKYVMVLMGPVVFSPHLAWNARNEWVPIRMQAQHGFQGGHDPGFTLPADLPLAERPDPDSPEYRLGAYFRPPPIADPPPPPKEASALVELLRRTGEYVGGLLIVWGAFLAPLIHRFIARLLGRLPPEPPLTRSVKPLLVAATWVPIIFFGLVSLVSPVQTNWPAMYTVGAAALLAGFGASRLGPMIICSAINLVLFMALVLYVHNPAIAPTPGRVHHETHGWRELANHVAQLEGPIFTGWEQATSMIRFYRPDLTVVQWPGINQPSEFVRRREWNPYSRADLEARGSFWLVIGGPSPPRLLGFEPVEITELRDCLSEGLVVTEVSTTQPFDPPCPDGTVHIWYLVRYRAVGQP